MKNRPFFPLLALVLSLLAACSSAVPAQNTKEIDSQQLGSGEPQLHDLESVEAFREIFNQDAGKPRLVLLLSPT